MAVGMEPDEFSRTYPVSRAAYVIPADSHDFESVLSDALGADSLRPVRRSLRDYYLGDFPAEGYADVFVAAAQEELDFAARGHRFDATITEG